MAMNVKMELRSKEKVANHRRECRVGTTNANMHITAPATAIHPGSFTCWSSENARAMACN